MIAGARRGVEKAANWVPATMCQTRVCATTKVINREETWEFDIPDPELPIAMAKTRSDWHQKKTQVMRGFVILLIAI